MEFLPLHSHKSPRFNLFSRFLLKAESGFTLLELLAVLFIIGIIVSFAGISIGQKSNRSVQDDAERLYGVVGLVAEEAVLQGRELAIEVTRDSYRFLELDKENKWNLVGNDSLLRERAFSPGVNLDLLIEGENASFGDEKNLPRIFVLSSGELTAFTLSLSYEDEKAYFIRGAINGALTLNRDDEVDPGA